MWSYDINQTTGIVSSHVTRLNVLVWWDEPNTGSGQSKASASVYLVDDSGTVLDFSNNDNGVGGEQVVSLTFDKSVEPKPRPTGGGPLKLYLFVSGDIPADGDDETDSYYGETRDCYVSCTWEVGADDTLVDCDGTILDVGAALSGIGELLSGGATDSRISNYD